jgi:hypothetical protein
MRVLAGVFVCDGIYNGWSSTPHAAAVAAAPAAAAVVASVLALLLPSCFLLLLLLLTIGLLHAHWAAPEHSSRQHGSVLLPKPSSKALC